ncbi:MAG: hypothetical protein JSU96_04155, partial [Acidobacteriota bacterium]
GRALNDCNQSRNKVYDDVCTPEDNCSPEFDGTKAYIDLTQTDLAEVCYVRMTDYPGSEDGDYFDPGTCSGAGSLGFDLDAIYAGSQRFSNCSPVDTVEVEIDIKPGSDPNCFNINGHGIIPVAINGSASFDVSGIDISTLIFAGLEVRTKGNGTPQCSFQDWNGDGYEDLVCQFVDNPDFWNPGIGEATLTGELFDGRLFDGTDYICVQPGW